VLTDDGRKLAQSIQEGEAIAVSNGSFKHSFGTVAWIVQSADGDSELQGRAIFPGLENDNSPFQSELTGHQGLLFKD
jgi:hypothetical protein